MRTQCIVWIAGTLWQRCLARALRVPHNKIHCAGNSRSGCCAACLLTKAVAVVLLIGRRRTAQTYCCCCWQGHFTLVQRRNGRSKRVPCTCRPPVPSCICMRTQQQLWSAMPVPVSMCTHSNSYRVRCQCACGMPRPRALAAEFSLSAEPRPAAILLTLIALWFSCSRSRSRVARFLMHQKDGSCIYHRPSQAPTAAQMLAPVS